MSELRNNKSDDFQKDKSLNLNSVDFNESSF